MEKRQKKGLTHFSANPFTNIRIRTKNLLSRTQQIFWLLRYGKDTFSSVPRYPHFQGYLAAKLATLAPDESKTSG